MKPAFRLHLAGIGFFSALTFIVLHKIIFLNGTHTAGYDFFAYNWNFWWTRYSLTEPGLTMFESNFVMFPAVSNYGFHTLTQFWFPVWAILEPLVGTLTAVNVILFMGCFLNGYLTFALLRSEKIIAGWALLGGTAVQIFPIARYFYYNTHLNLMDWFWIPAHLLMWKQLVFYTAAKRYRLALLWAVLHGVALWGLGLTDLQFPIFVGFALIPFGLLTLWQNENRVGIVGAGIVSVTVCLLLLWVAGPLPQMLEFSGTRVTSPVEDRPGVEFPQGFLSMSETWWDWSTPTTGRFISLIILISVGMNVWKLFFQASKTDGIYTVPTENPQWFWFAVMLPPLIFAMGPTVTLGGTDIPMPFRTLYAITDGMFRMPWRLAPVFVICGMIFVGKTWRFSSPSRLVVLGCLFGLLFVDVRLFETAPMQPILYPYQFYEEIRAEEGDYGILEIPTGAGTGEVLLGDPRAIQFQWYGMTHQKRMVNGFIARAPLENYWYLHLDDPMMAWLGQRRAFESHTIHEQLRERIFGWPLGYFIVHKDYVIANGGKPEEILGYFNSLHDLLCVWQIEGNAVAYRTAWHPAGCPSQTPHEIEPNIFQIDIGSLDDQRFIGWGWHYAEHVGGVTLRWAGDTPQTSLHIDLPAGTYQVTLSAQAFHESRELGLAVNGIILAETAQVGTDSLQTYTFTLPAEIVAEGENLDVMLQYDDWVVPSEVMGGGDVRKLAVAVDWIRFERID